jgi:hypothetical protein
LQLSFQNLESLIDVVITNQYLHAHSIQFVAAAASLGQAVNDAFHPSVEDMIDA